MTSDPSKEFREANRLAWNAVVGPHLESELYDVETFKEGKTSLRSIELEALGDVSGKSMLHLQCHFGMDTLSWARLGAEVTGADISDDAIGAARELSDEIGVSARFVASDIYELPERLDQKFDIVFTSYGALGWLPDLKRWASVVRHFVKPGGIFFMVEFHPLIQTLDFEKQQFGYDYFHSAEPLVWDGTPDYAAKDVPHEGNLYEWQFSLEDVISPLLNQGMILEEFREFPWSPTGSFPNMESAGEGKWKVKEPPFALPHVFSVKFRR